MSKPGRSAANFDHVADVYRWAEYLALGRLLEKTRKHFLPRLADRTQALALGDGDGRFLAALLKQNSKMTATAVDTSKRMLTLLERRCGAFGDRLHTEQRSALLAVPAFNTDLIITHFFLDCLAQGEVDALARKIFLTVPLGAVWVVSDFAVPDRPVVKPLANAYINLLYFAFRLTTGLPTRSLPEIETPLQHAGFVRLSRKEFLFGVLYTELWERQGAGEYGDGRATTAKMETSTHVGKTKERPASA